MNGGLVGIEALRVCVCTRACVAAVPQLPVQTWSSPPVVLSLSYTGISVGSGFVMMVPMSLTVISYDY